MESKIEEMIYLAISSYKSLAPYFFPSSFFYCIYALNLALAHYYYYYYYYCFVVACLRFKVRREVKSTFLLNRWI